MTKGAAGHGFPLPRKRDSATYELVVEGESGRLKMYLTVGRGEDGRPLEIWLDVAKEGTMLRELMHAWASLFSIALQSGVPLGRLVKLYRPWCFQPAGRVEGFPKIEFCTSVLSLVVSVLEAEFPSFLSEPPSAQKELF